MLDVVGTFEAIIRSMAVEFAADEDPGKATLAEELLQVVGAEGLADEVGGSVRHGCTLQRREGRVTYAANND